MELGNWKNLDESKFETIQMNDNHLTGAKRLRTFIVWNNILEFCLYLSDYIDRYKGNYGRWNTTDPAKQKVYMAKVNSVKNRFIV